MKINSVSGVKPLNPAEKIREYDEIKRIQTPEKEKIQTKSAEDKMKQVKEYSDVGVLEDDMLEKAVDQANKTLEMYHRRIDRSIHEVTKTVMYTIRDTETNEVIQEFPPRKIQDMIAKMWELAGLFVDEKA